jgi:hypothetical protein
VTCMQSTHDTDKHSAHNIHQHSPCIFIAESCHPGQAANTHALHTHMHAYTHKHTHARVRNLPIKIYVHLYLHWTHTQTLTLTHIHTHTHTLTHIHTHTPLTLQHHRRKCASQPAWQVPSIRPWKSQGGQRRKAECWVSPLGQAP